MLPITLINTMAVLRRAIHWMFLHKMLTLPSHLQYIGNNLIPREAFLQDLVWRGVLLCHLECGRKSLLYVAVNWRRVRAIQNCSHPGFSSLPSCTLDTPRSPRAPWILLEHPGFSSHTLDSPRAPWILLARPGISSRTLDSPSPYENVVNFTMIKSNIHHGYLSQ
jgi:hypothetical protein